MDATTSPSSAAPPSADRHVVRLALFAVTLLAVLVYANAVRNGYAVDDEPIIRDNPVVHGLGHLHDLLLRPYWPRSDEMWRPVTLFSFAAEWQVLGSAPAVSHAVSVLLHAGVVALLFLLLIRLRASLPAAALGAAAFAVHPLHVEAVANLVGRAEVLATGFALAACLVHLAPRLGRGGRIALVCVLYALAMGSKESAVTLPALVLIADALARRGTAEGGVIPILRRNALEIAAMAGTLAVFLVVRAGVVGVRMGTAPAPYTFGLSTSGRLAVAARLWPEFLRLLFWPADLAMEWGPGSIEVATWRDPGAWAGVAVCVALAAAAVVAWRRERWIGAAVLWFAVAVLPVSHIPFPVGVMIAERTLYLPSVAVAFLAPPLVALGEAAPRRWRTGLVAAAVLVLALGAARTWRRTPVWASSNAAYQSLMEEHPESWAVDWRAAQLLARAGRVDEAMPWYRQALEKTRGHHTDIDVDLASLYLRQHRPRDAEPLLRQVIHDNPGRPAPWFLLSSALLDEGRPRDAIAPAEAGFRVAEGAQPWWRFELEHRLALAYDALGVRDSALAARRASLAIAAARRAPGPWYHLARLEVLAGDTAAAAAALDSARARVAPALRPRLTLHPLPAADDPAMRGWVPWGATSARTVVAAPGAPR